MGRYYRGRGAFESMGAGLDMDVGDIAFKCNLACLNRSSGIVESRRADRRLLLHHTTSPEVFLQE